MTPEELNAHCAKLADMAVPEYRSGTRTYSCSSWTGKRWSAAYEGARLALTFDPPISNPSRWFYAHNEDCEWWHIAGDDRAAAERAAREHYPDGAVILLARRMLPSFDVFHAADIMELINDQEAWGEDGWEGSAADDGPEGVELERELASTLKRWFARHCSLSGAQLDFDVGPLKLDGGQ